MGFHAKVLYLCGFHFMTGFDLFYLVNCELRGQYSRTYFFATSRLCEPLFFGFKLIPNFIKNNAITTTLVVNFNLYGVSRYGSLPVWIPLYDRF
jgi:hypothetical protein